MEIDIEKALNFIWKNSDAYAKAKANVVYMTEFRKSTKAICFQNSLRSTMAEKEADAYSHPDYIKVLEGIRAAVEEAEALRWKLIASQASVEVWRSQEASNRNIDKSTQ